MIFPHQDQPPVGAVEYGIGITALRRLANGLRRFAQRLAIQFLIGKIGEVNCPFSDQHCRSAVFMDPGAGVEGGRRHVFCRPVDAILYHHETAAFLRTPFTPVNVISIEPGFRQGNRIPDD